MYERLKRKSAQAPVRKDSRRSIIVIRCYMRIKNPQISVYGGKE